MVLMRVRQHNAANIARRQPVLSQPRAQRVNCVARFRAGVDNGDRIFFDEIDVNCADVERRGKGNGNDLH